jgi:hypothetical protein
LAISHAPARARHRRHRVQPQTRLEITGTTGRLLRAFPAHRWRKTCRAQSGAKAPRLLQDLDVWIRSPRLRPTIWTRECDLSIKMSPAASRAFLQRVHSNDREIRLQMDSSRLPTGGTNPARRGAAPVTANARTLPRPVELFLCISIAPNGLLYRHRRKNQSQAIAGKTKDGCHNLGKIMQ